MNSKNKILVEEIIQKFDTEELSYFKLGSISGEVNSDGKDQIDHAVTLVIPKSKIKNFFNQFKKAVEFKEEELIESKDDKDKKKEILGSPISISHPKLR